MAALVGWLDQRQQDEVDYLIEDNRILRRPPKTLHLLTQALDLDLQWVQETGGEIHRIETFDGTPELYKATA